MNEIVEILLAEDNPADVVLLSEALESTAWKHRLHVVHDGVETLAFLGRREGHSEAPRPHLILLDHNLPKKNGTEVLAEIKGNPVLSGIPIVVFSGGEMERGAVMAFGLPEECFIVKPATYSGYLMVARQIEGIWRTAAGTGGP